MAKLTFILDDGETIEVPLHDHVTIGRADGNDVVVYDPRISSRHAELHFLTDGGFEVRDLASKAGTFVNGERVERKILGHGDTVSFGPLKGEYTVEGNEPNGARPRPTGAPQQMRHAVQTGGARSIIKHPTTPMDQDRPNTGNSGGGRLLSSVSSTPKVEIVPDPMRPAASGNSRLTRSAADALSPGPAYGSKANPSAPVQGGDQSRPATKPEASKLLAAVLAIPGENAAPRPVEDAGKNNASQPPRLETRQPAPHMTSSLARPVTAQTRSDVPPKQEPPVKLEPARPAPAALPSQPSSSTSSESGRPASWAQSTRPASPEPPSRDARLQNAARLAAQTQPQSQTEMRTAADSKLAAEARPRIETRPETKLASEGRPAAETRQPAARALPQPQQPAPAPQRSATFQSQLPPVSLGTDAASPPGRSRSAEPPAEQPGTHAAAAPPASISSMPPSDIKSSTPSVIEAAPGLDQRVVSLVYSKLQGDAKAAISSLEQRQKALDDEVSRMKYELIGMQEERRKIVQSQAEFEQAQQAEQRKLESLRQEHASAEKKFLQFTTSIKQAQDRLADLQAQERQLAHVTDELGQAERKRQELHDSIEALVAEGEAKRAEVQSSIDAAQAEAERTRREAHASIESLMAESEAKRSEVRSTVEALMHDGESKRGEVQAAIDALLAEGEIKRAEVQAAIDALGAEGDAKHAEILASIEALNADGEARRAEWYAEISRIAAEGEARRAEWQNEFEKLDADAEAHQDEINAAINALRQEEETARAAVQRQHDELQRLVDAGQDALREVEAMTSNKEQMGVQLLNLLK